MARADFLLALRVTTGQPIRARTLRAYEQRENAVPVWIIEGYRRTLSLTDAEVTALVEWASENYLPRWVTP